MEGQEKPLFRSWRTQPLDRVLPALLFETPNIRAALADWWYAGSQLARAEPPWPSKYTPSGSVSIVQYQHLLPSHYSTLKSEPSQFLKYRFGAGLLPTGNRIRLHRHLLAYDRGSTRHHNLESRGSIAALDLWSRDDCLLAADKMKGGQADFPLARIAKSLSDAWILTCTLNCFILFYFYFYSLIPYREVHRIWHTPQVISSHKDTRQLTSKQ